MLKSNTLYVCSEAREGKKVTKMSAVRTILAITFVFFLTVTFIAPTFPPAQLLYIYVKIPQTTLSIWGISVATLLNAMTNGFFWTIIVAIACGLTQLALSIRVLRPLPSMPVAPRLTTPPPENPLVDSLVNVVPPALTISEYPSFKVREEPARVMTRAEPVPIRISSESAKKEIDIETVEGIGLKCGGLLRNLGIDTASDLLKLGASERGRFYIANKVGVTSATVLKWVCRADLLRVRGVGRKYSALLEWAGVYTTRDLSAKNPHYLCQTLRAVNKERNLVGRTPPSKTVEIWVHNAKKLEPVM